MTALIEKSNIESNAYSNIFDIMNNRSNIADPRGSSASGRAFILDADPLVKALDFSGYPYIVLELPTLEYSREGVSGTKKFITWTHKITVRTARDGSAGNVVNTGRTDILAIGDDLNETFNKLDVKSELAELNIREVKLSKSTTDVFTISQKTVYEATYELEYQIRLLVSS